MFDRRSVILGPQQVSPRVKVFPETVPQSPDGSNRAVGEECSIVTLMVTYRWKPKHFAEQGSVQLAAYVGCFLAAKLCH